MSNILLFLILLAAVAMPLWIARCRKRGNRRWVLPWLATLLPLGALLLLGGLLDNNITRLLLPMVLLGMAAFAGGALFLVAPVLWGVASEAILRARMAEASAPKRRHEDRRVDDEDDSTVPVGYRRTYFGGGYEPIDYGDEESDDYYRNGKPG